MSIAAYCVSANGGFLKTFTTADTENTEGAQRIEFSLCPLCVLCASVVSALILPHARRGLYEAGTFMFKVRTRKPQRSAYSSMIFEVGLPAPCPAFVSMRMRTGAGPPCAACIAAANLKL
jgi:hypothetical protein